MNNPEIIDKIEKLNIEFSDASATDRATIRDWAKSIRENLAVLELKENKGMRMIMEELDRKISDCTKSLAENETMSEEDRQLIFRERRCWRWFRFLFDGAEKTVKLIGKQVEDNLET